MAFHWISIFVLFSRLWYWFKSFGTRLMGLILLLSASPGASATDIAVLEFELNDLTLNPNLVEEAERSATLRPLLVEQFTDHHNITVIANPPSARVEANKGKGYLFDRPALVAKIGREIGVDCLERKCTYPP